MQYLYSSLLILLLLGYVGFISGQIVEEEDEEEDDETTTTPLHLSTSIVQQMNTTQQPTTVEITSVATGNQNRRTTKSSKKTTLSKDYDYNDEKVDDVGDSSGNSDTNYCTSSRAVYTEKQIAKKILKDYQPNVRPRKDARDPVDVHIALALTGIQEFNEKESTVKLIVTVKQFWSDPYLVYNDTDRFHCTDFFLLPATSIWLPDIQFIDSPDGGKSILDPSNLKAWVYSDGDVFLQANGILAVKCKIDTRMYPYDKTTCEIRVQSVNYIADQLAISFYSKETDEFQRDDDPFEVSELEDNPIWEVTEASTESRVDTFDDGDISPILVFRLSLQRKRLYYNINILTPSIILTATVFVNFVLPVDDGSKLWTGFAILLAYTIFQMMVLGDIPRSSDDIPIFSIYILLQRIYIALIIIYGQGIVFMILSKATACKNKNGQAPTKRLYRSFEIMGKILLVRPIIKYSSAVTNKQLEEKKANAEPVVNKSDTTITVAEVNAEPAVNEVSTSDNKKPIGEEKAMIADVEICDADKWTYIAMVTDRITFVLYLIVTIVTPIVITKVPDAIYAKEDAD